jgi:hypothetical protein
LFPFITGYSYLANLTKMPGFTAYINKFWLPFRGILRHLPAIFCQIPNAGFKTSVFLINLPKTNHMKKIFTLLLLTGILNSQAQSYQPMLADSVTHFQVASLGIPVRMQQSTNCTTAYPGDYYAQTDSVYLGATYKRFYEYGSYFMGLMREDTAARKVYFIQSCNTTEELLYDFSLQVGDSINYTFPNTSGSYIKNGWYKVDSIRYKHDYKGYYRRHFYLCNRLNPLINGVNPRASLEMIEGVGSTTHPLFLYAWFNPGILSVMGTTNPRCFDTEYDELLTCKWNNGSKVYFDSCAYTTAQSNSCVSHNDSCYYSTICSAVQEFNGIKNIAVFPNPASEVAELEIEADRQADLSFSIVNQLGIEVKKETKHQLIKGKNYFKIPVKDLPPGFYLIQISDGSKSVGKPLLINH